MKIRRISCPSFVSGHVIQSVCSFTPVVPGYISRHRAVIACQISIADITAMIHALPAHVKKKKSDENGPAWRSMQNRAL